MSVLIQNILPSPKRAIIFIHPDLNIKQCVDIMTRDNIGALVVTDDYNFIGIVSERDIVRNVINRNLSPETTTARDILYTNVSVLKPSDTVGTAMAIITETKRHHLLIAEDGELIAVLSIGDILYSMLADSARTIEQLERYIKS